MCVMKEAGPGGSASGLTDEAKGLGCLLTSNAHTASKDCHLRCGFNLPKPAERMHLARQGLASSRISHWRT